MTNLFAAFFLLITLPFVQPHQAWKPVQSTVSFAIRNVGVTTDGHFEGFEAEINFLPDDLAGSSVTASVKAKTIDTGIDLRDKHLRDEDYFDVENHQLIKLKSNSFKKTASDKYEGNFILTLKGTSREIILPFTFKEKNGQATFDGFFTIDRRDFGVGGNSFTLADDVTVHIVVKADKV